MTSFSFEISLATASGLADFCREHSGKLTATNVIEFDSCADENNRFEVYETLTEFMILLDAFGFEILSKKIIHTI